MKKVAVVTATILATLGLAQSAGAVPIANISWTEPTNYEDGTIIDPATDTISYTVYCSDVSGSGYNLMDSGISGNASPVDMTTCVNGAPGTYYVVMTANSSLYGEESVLSVELPFTVTAADLGKVPNAPVIITITVQ